jgi:hypothetical protein
MRDNYLRGYVVAGRYTILGLLEDRGSGALYQAKDDETRAYVLLKHSPDTSAAARRRFERERQRRINHPNIARRLDCYWFDGDDLSAGGWEVFEWSEGRTLASWLAEHDNIVEPSQAVRMMLPICRAVNHLHETHLHGEDQGNNEHGDQPRLIHNHITLNSIGLRRDQEGHLRAFLRDYGTSHVEQPYQLSSVAALRAERAGAPEQFHETDRSSSQSDVYAVGAALYQLVTGHSPASGEDRLRYRAHVERANVVNPAVPQSIADAIERAMAFDPRQRFASAAELGAALEEAIRQPPVGTTGWFWAVMAGIVVVVGTFMLWLASQNVAPTAGPVMPTGVGAGGVQPTAAPLPTPLPPTATPDALATLTAADAAFVTFAGPLAGELPVTAAGPGAALVGGLLVDLAVEAVFVNPNVPAWDYGFAFRHSPTAHFRLSVASDSTWLLTYRSEDPAVPGYFAETTVAQGAATLALGAGETNQLRLSVAGTYGVLTVNGQPMAPFSLWGKVEAGDVYAAAGLRGASNGTAVTYRDLIVRGPQ